MLVVKPKKNDNKKRTGSRVWREGIGEVNGIGKMRKEEGKVKLTFLRRGFVNELVCMAGGAQ